MGSSIDLSIDLPSGQWKGQRKSAGYRNPSIDFSIDRWASQWKGQWNDVNTPESGPFDRAFH